MKTRGDEFARLHEGQYLSTERPWNHVTQDVQSALRFERERKS